MPLTLLAPQTQTFKLEKIDNTGDTFAVFRQATMKQEEQRQQLLAIQEYAWNDKEAGTVSRKSRVNFAELARKEVNLTLIDCNIMVQNGTNDDGTPKIKPLFNFGKVGEIVRELEFVDAWGQLPADWANELQRCCHEVNKDWAPNSQAKGE